MPRDETGLTGLLQVCETESLVDIVTRTGAESFHFTTAREGLTVSSVDYTNHLLRVGELKESGGQETNRVNVRVSNEAESFGVAIASQLRTLQLADVTIKRFMAQAGNRAASQTPVFFKGKLINAETVSEVEARDAAGKPTLIKKYISFDVIPKTTASGISVAVRTLSPSCAWVFKDENCLYSGIETVCNKQLKSVDGCMGRANTEHFGGWTFPETPTQGLPSTTSGGGGIGGGTCFAPETLIETLSGLRRIEDFKQGDAIYSFSEKTLEIEADAVKEFLSHTADGIFTVTFAGGSTIKVTPEHRFLIGANKWIAADDFIAGETEILRLIGGEWKRSKVAKISYFGGAVKVFNLHVEKNQTFFAEGFAVHNAKENPDIVV